MYYVVRWDDSSEMICETWVDFLSHSFHWPKSKNPVAQVIKKEKPQENWYLFKYSRIFGPYETYDDARSFESNTFDISTNDDDGFATYNKKKTEMMEIPKRRNYKPKRYCTTSSDELSKPKKIKKKGKHFSSSSSSEYDENDPKIGLPKPPSHYVSQKNCEFSKIPKSMDSKFYETSPLKDSTNDCLQRQNTNLLFDTEKNNDYSSSLADKEEKFRRNLDKLQKIVTAIYLVVSKKDDLPNSTFEDAIDFKFKIDSKKDLDNLEKQLKDSLAAAQYKRMIRQVGGEFYERHVRRALSLTFSNVMAYRMSWTGAKNTFMIKDKNYINIILEVILQQWPQSNQAATETVIKSWFQHAGDRMKQKSSK